MVNFFEPAASLAKAAFTFWTDALMMEIIVDALAWVEIVDVVLMVTTEPESFNVTPATVIFLLPSAEASAVMFATEPSTRLVPLKFAFCTIAVIWSRKAVKSAFKALRLAVSSEASAAASALAFSSFSKSEIDWPADRATSTVDTPRLRLSDTA